MQLFFLYLTAAVAGSPYTATDIVRFKSKEVLVSDSDGVPLFLAKRDFVLKLGHNPPGEVIAYDARSKRVRVSKAGTELWLYCSDLEPMKASCPAAAVRTARSAAIRGSYGDAAASAKVSAREVPVCPDDPRCPLTP
jgi:hypothetical protein